MPNITPIDRASVPELEDFFKGAEYFMGFVPNSMLTMAHKPELLKAFTQLAAVVLTPTRVSPELLDLVSFVSSSAAGCRYCQAHTSATSLRHGVSPEKLAAAFEFETDPRFTEAERAALRYARDASLAPGAADATHFEALRQHFDQLQIVELTAMIALFGWLNRWNDAVATQLESEPRAAAERNLAPHGWQVGKHADEKR